MSRPPEQASHRSTTSVLRDSILTLILAMGPGSIPGSGQEPDCRPSAAGFDIEAEIGALLRDGDGAAASDPEQLGRRLASLGAGSLPILFQLLADGPPSTLTAEQPLAPAQRAAVLSAFGDLPRGAVRDMLEQLEAGQPTGSELGAALSIWGEVGRMDDLEHLLLLTGTLEVRGEVAFASLAAELESSMVRILTREPDACSWLRPQIQASAPEVGAVLVSVVGGVAPSRGLEVLAELLGWCPVPDHLLLAELEHLSRRVAPPAGELVLDPIRRYLQDEDPAILELSCSVLGSLEDRRAVPRLLELLEEAPSQGVRHASHQALRGISAQPFSADVRRWHSWFAGEREWWDDRSLAVLEALDSENYPDIAAAVSELVRHRLYRHELAAEVLGLLTHPDPRVRSIACLGLGQLGSPLAIESLIDRLDDVDGEVCRAASVALRVLHDEELPADPEWLREALTSRF